MRVPVSSPVIRGLLIVSTIVCLLWIALALSLPYLLDINRYRGELVSILEQELHRPVQLGSGTLSWRIGPTVTFDGCTIHEADRAAILLHAKTVSIRIGILPLLRKEIALRQVTLDGLRLNLLRDYNGRLSIDDLLQPSSGRYRLSMHRLKLHDATINWQDNKAGAAPVTITMHALHGSIVDPVRGGTTKINLAGKLTPDGGDFSCKGTLKTSLDSDLLKNSFCDLQLKLSNFAYGRFWRYAGQQLPFDNPGGTLSGTGSLKGRLDDFQGQTDLTLRQPHLVWPKVFRTDLKPRQVSLSTTFTRNTATISFKDIKAAIDGVEARGRLTLRDLASNDPYIDAQGDSASFDYAHAKPYIPFPIIDQDPAFFIEHRIKAGIFKVQTATLQGKLSTIKNLGVGTNAQALYLRGSVERGVISYGGKSPSFNDLHGTLELKGTSFNLLKTRGKFGTAPFTLDGSITEYATIGVPCTYPFTMHVTPQAAEVAWLANLVGLDTLRYTGNAPLALHGDGPSSKFRLSGEWQLADSTLQLPDILAKTSGTPASVNFSTTIDAGATRFNSVALQMAAARFSGSGLLRYDKEIPQLQFNVESNRFQLDPTSPLFPILKPYQVHGGVQGHISGTGAPTSLGAMRFNGAIHTHNLSARPPEKIPPLTGINATIALKGDMLETSRLAVTYGSSHLLVRGRINHFAQPEAEFDVTARELHLADIDITMPEPYRTLSQCSGTVSMKDNQLVIKQFHGRFPQGGVSVSGTTPMGNAAGASRLRIAFDMLDLDNPPIPKTDPLPTASKGTTPTKGGTQASTSRPRILELQATRGIYDDTRFNNLQATIEQRGAVTTIHQARANLLGGSLTLQGSYRAKTDKEPLSFDLEGGLKQVKASQLLQKIGAGRELTGPVSLQAKLRARGNDKKALFSTLHGSVTIAAEAGVLKRFNTLSKVISLLNVSQLLSFSLPDMAKGGMPYNRISGTANIKDGIIRTDDFFINSNVMNMSAVGSVDLPREQVSITIGAQPLQTVDKIINRLPVVGWILSGGRGHTLSTYFQVSGNMKDPEVTAIPVQSIAVGTMEVFQRVFQLPFKLFTDTGEVLLNSGRKK